MNPIRNGAAWVAALLALASLTACSSSLEQTSLPETPPQTAGQAQAPSTTASASADDADSAASDSDTNGESAAPVSGADQATAAPSGTPGHKAPAGRSPSVQSPAGSSGHAAVRYVCHHPAAPGRRECDAILRTDAGGARPGGYHGAALIQAFSRGPHSCNRSAPYCASDLQAAYGVAAIAKTAGRSSTVGVVDAYGYPNAASDLAVYRKSMGLSACSTASGCLRIVNQSGQLTPLPKPNADPSEDWRPEQALDLDMISAICPNCKIILVQAYSNKDTDLAAGVNAAIDRGAVAVSNSYSGAEEDAANSAYQHPGKAITASAGDEGFGPRAPCSYAGVVCVGGTSLLASLGRGWSESAWGSTGSGCSAYVAKPQWQHVKGCPMRTEADISAVADPSTGVAFYEAGAGGWMQIGGTSVSAPIVAAAFALGPRAARANAPQWIWRHGGSFAYRDVVVGSNGSCSVSYLCHAREGYDGPTGWGTPNGIAGL